MIELSFPTRKLKGLVKRVNIKLKNTDLNGADLTVYGVTNKDGITVTGNTASEDLSNYLILHEKQFAYNPYRMNVGSLGLASKGTIGLISPAYVIFEAKEGINPEFLFYYLKSNLGLNLIKWYGDRGGVRSALRFSDLENIDIPDLDVIYQEKLLNKLKEVDSELTTFNLSIDKQIEYVKKLRNSILQDAVQGKLVPQDPSDEPAEVLLERIQEEKERLIGEKKIKREKPLSEISDEEKKYNIPSSWKFMRMGNIATTITDGTHQTPKYCEDGMMFLSAQNVKPFKFMPYNYRCVSKEDYEGYTKNVKPEVGDILLTRVGANIGEAAVINKGLEFAIYVSLCLIKISESKFYSDYICLWLNSPDGTEKSISNILGRGTSQGNLNLSLIRNFVIPIPPFEEQKRIVEKVDSLMQLCDELEKKIERSKKYSEKLMESILKDSFKA